MKFQPTDPGFHEIVHPYQAREGVFSRPTVLMNAKTMEPAKWWSMYGRHLPLLSSIASRVLAQPGAASWAERNWSRA